MPSFDDNFSTLYWLSTQYQELTKQHPLSPNSGKNIVEIGNSFYDAIAASWTESSSTQSNNNNISEYYRPLECIL